MKIIPAQIEHLDSLVKLNAEVQNLHIGFEPEIFKQPSHNEVVAMFEEFLMDEDRKTLICFEKNQLIGYISLRIGGHEGHALCFPQKWIYIDQIGVTAKFRRKGVGKKLIEAAQEIARQNQINRLMLDVWNVNQNAKEFFKAQGFNSTIERMIMEI